MNDQEYIKAGVGLADGWLERDEFIIGPSPLMDYYTPEGIAQPILDALAAQLVRQVDALTDYGFLTDESRAAGIYHCGSGSNCVIADSEDRTLNTIKAIVDSGVLT